MIEINKIYCENCIETLKRMPDNFVDLTITSPPYDDMDENFNPISKHGQRTYNGYEWDFKTIAQELFRVIKQGGVVVWVVNDPTINGSESLASSYQKIYFRRVGFNIHDTMIYKKNGMRFPRFNHFIYPSVFEYTILLGRGKPKTFRLLKDIKNINIGKKINCVLRNPDGKLKASSSNGRLVKNFGVRSNVWEYQNGYGLTSTDSIAFDHPAIFPEALARDHIYSWSNEGNLIYDPFMGSGTVAKMAHLMKRNWIGSEISQAYVDLANKRLEKYLNQTDLFEMPVNKNGQDHKQNQVTLEI